MRADTLRLRRAITIALLVPTLYFGNGRAAGGADLSAGAPAEAEAQPLPPQEQTATLVGRWPAPEARQGVAVDATAFYAIDNRAIGKYDKTSGQKVAEWKAGPNEPFIHMNGGVVIGDELLCPHSNYPATPMVSSIEVFDASTLRHKRSQPLGKGRGSITWVDYHNGSWWVAFAHYTRNGGEPGKGSEMTTLRRFDAAWREQESWSFPPEVVGKWAGMSSSGGVWGPDDRLYTTGHDEPEIYVLAVPPGGGTLSLVSVIRMESAGQGIAFDRAAGRLYSIQRATREVVASTLPRGRATPLPVPPALVAMSGDRTYRFYEWATFLARLRP